MDREFVTMMVRVFAVGLFAVGIGTVALVIAFRALGEKGDRRGATALLVAIALIAVICAILFRWSYASQ